MSPDHVQPRRFRRDRVLQISPDAYEHAIELLATAALASGPVTAVIGIANGGRTPALGLHGRLDAPLYLINAQHNPTDAIYTQATAHVTIDLQPLLTELDGRTLDGTVLLVDDICGSGATFRTVLRALATELTPPPAVRTIALCRNAAATFNPDHWIWTVDDWVSFPWEPTPPPGTPIEALAIPETVMTS